MSDFLTSLTPHFTHKVRTADFTVGGKNTPATLTIFDVVPGVSRERVAVYEVTGKREARTVAKRVGAMPWNF